MNAPLPQCSKPKQNNKLSLTPSALRIWAGLLIHCVRWRSRTAAPSQGDIAAIAGTCERTVIRCEQQLEAAGLISVDRRPRPGARNSHNLISFHWLPGDASPAPAALDSTWRVFASLFAHRDRATSSTFVGKERQASDCHVSPKTVQRAWRRLEALGIIRVKERRSPGKLRQETNHITILTTFLPVRSRISSTRTTIDLINGLRTASPAVQQQIFADTPDSLPTKVDQGVGDSLSLSSQRVTPNSNVLDDKSSVNTDVFTSYEASVATTTNPVTNISLEESRGFLNTTSAPETVAEPLAAAPQAFKEPHYRRAWRASLATAKVGAPVEWITGIEGICERSHLTTADATTILTALIAEKPAHSFWRHWKQRAWEIADQIKARKIELREAKRAAKRSETSTDTKKPVATVLVDVSSIRGEILPESIWLGVVARIMGVGTTAGELRSHLSYVSPEPGIRLWLLSSKIALVRRNGQVFLVTPTATWRDNINAKWWAVLAPAIEAAVQSPAQLACAGDLVEQPGKAA